jgi:excisionase family DNA binding protein
MINGGVTLARKEISTAKPDVLPMLKTVEQMSRVSGIGENKLRELMDSGELEYVQNGNRRLIADTAIWNWYNRVKTTAAKGA